MHVQIMTSSWFTKLPAGAVRIGTSRGSPRGTAAGYRYMRELCPGSWFKSCATPREYRERYFAEVLSKLDPQETVDRIAGLTRGAPAVLVCFEAPNAVEANRGWCHRALISAWLHDELGLIVRELGREADGYGWNHPLLARELRRPDVPPPEPIDVTPYVGRQAKDAAGDGETWRVVGPSADYPDQAEVMNVATGEIRTVSLTVLERRFA